MPLRVVKRKNTKALYIRGTVRGIYRYETTGTDDPATAEAMRIRREHELLQHSVFGGGATVTFKQAAASYLEHGGEARFLGRFDAARGRWTLLIGRFGAMPIARIGQAEIDAAAHALYPSATAAARKRMVYVPASAVLHHAQGKGWGVAPRLRHPKVAPPVTKWARPDELERLLPHCAPNLRRLVVMLAYTGARLAEALRVEWEGDIDLNRRTVILRRTKNGKMRTVHISDSLLVELATVPAERRHGSLFRWAHKSHVYGPLRTAFRRAGIAYLTPHQLGRHTFATWLRIYAGRDLRGLQEDGGWDSIVSVTRYAHVVPGETVAAVNLLPDVQNAGSGDIRLLKDRRMRRKLG